MDQNEQDKLRQEVDEVLHGQKQPQEPAGFQQNDYSNIRHVIGVMSGKGGVGKSLVCGILAVELARRGARVGILDADITGPSIPRMMGLADARARGVDDLIVPVLTKGGIKVMSANLVLEHESDPVLWRGPVVAGAIKQFWEDCAWGELDYLLVDMPPGTGDVALTVFQSLPVDGVVIVSSPQDLVQMVVGKAVNMANMMNVPVLGLVENMAYVECPHCGERIYPYGPSRLAETAQAFDVDALGQLPMDAALAEACDTGTFEGKLPEGLLPDAVEAVVRTAEFMDALHGQDK
ncbi:Mrp/NBP35 family ATP-binding protein [Olsenella uli]|uniref:Mrp/NBP35 family ATP-binding protein n=1 Tax=Olsenella uli TaxID=133926 RepID=UPI00195B4F0A|nr:Mrp/NBP35 family ATP-binding protein [Olsenella uli]MBM6675445.1 Mrp/NBP35 family ATP-binding protein [Olsenella uli]